MFALAIIRMSDYNYDNMVYRKDWDCYGIYTEIGGIVKITWESTPTMIRILVSDNGSGIAPEDIHHIFKRFYRSKYSLNTPGIGLGLPLAKSIIEGQEGLISVQSVLHEGTTFSVSFLTKS